MTRSSPDSGDTSDEPSDHDTDDKSPDAPPFHISVRAKPGNASDTIVAATISFFMETFLIARQRRVLYQITDAEIKHEPCRMYPEPIYGNVSPRTYLTLATTSKGGFPSMHEIAALANVSASCHGLVSMRASERG